MKQKKLISLLLASTMVVGMAACNKTDGKTDGKTTDQTGSESAAASEGGEAKVNEAGTYPIVNEPLTLTFSYGRNDLTDDLNSFPVFQELEKKTNIKIKWDYVGTTEWDTRKATAFATGELPDAFFGMGQAPLSDLDVISNEEAFVDMKPLIEKYAPNISKIMKEDTGMEKIVTTKDGKIYSLFQRMPLRPNTFDVGFINQKWLDNLGLTYPETTADFKDVLTAFKEKDANGNGDPNDEIPITFVGLNDLSGFKSLFGAFGITDSIEGNFLQVKDGKVEFWPILDNYKEAIKYFKDLYTNGLIDQEVFTQDFGEGTSKYRTDGATKVGVGFHWTISAGVGDKNAAEYVQLLPLKGPNGDQLWRQNPDKTKGGRNYFSITTKNQNPEATMRWVDELYNADVSVQLYFGSKEVGTRFTADNKIELLAPKDGMTEDSWQWKNALNDSGPLYVSESRENDIVRNDWVKTKLEYDEAYKKFVPSEWYPFVYWTNEEAVELNSLQTDIHPFVEQKMAEWITGTTDIDADWEAYKQQLQDMKLDRLMEIYESGYKSYFGN